MENVTIYGGGYVGLVTAACLAELGHHVFCVETNPDKLVRLQNFDCPIFEPGLAELIRKHGGQRLHFLALTPEIVKKNKIQIIAVGTPSNLDGTVNLDFVATVAKYLGSHLAQNAIIINKSTAPPGTTSHISRLINQFIKPGLEFSIVSNPEFLREGFALQDFFNPERIIVGCDDPVSAEAVRQLYEPLIKGSPEKFFVMSPSSAELTKYAANAFLAMKISFINEIAMLAEKVNADINQVKRGLGSDSRIGGQFLNAGCGFGGSCFPKDVLGLKHVFLKNGLEPYLLEATLSRNEMQKRALFDKAMLFYQGNITGRSIALWGLSFKPDTDDIRSASSCYLMELLWQHGVTVHAFDPLANTHVAEKYGPRPDLVLHDDMYEALKNCDGLMIVTEWALFKTASLSRIKRELKTAVIFDGRNIMSRDLTDLNQIQLFSIGFGLKEQESYEMRNG